MPGKSQKAAADRVAQSVRLPPQLRKRLRMWAAFKDVEISEIVEEAVKAHLNKLDRQREKKGFAPIIAPTE